MSIKTTELIKAIETIAPRSLEEDWDNSGWQINVGADTVDKVLLTLEITLDVIQEAQDLGVNMIISHHPLIFRPLLVIDDNNITGKHIVRLVSSGISVYSAHTNFDSAFGGINDDLAEILEVTKVRRIPPLKYSPNENVMGRMGEFDQTMTLKETCAHVKRLLNISRPLKTVGSEKTKIKKVAICGGAGADVIDAAIENNCGLLITGDLKHHDAQKAAECGLCIIDAGHVDTEKWFAANMAEKLDLTVGDDVELIQSQVNVEPFIYL